MKFWGCAFVTMAKTQQGVPAGENLSFLRYLTWWGLEDESTSRTGDSVTRGRRRTSLPWQPVTDKMGTGQAPTIQLAPGESSLASSP